MKIFLIGFMGSGKTYWGKLWAEAGKLSFFDLDALIEEQEKKSVTKIFEENGEAYFRQQETAMLSTFSNKENFILACGGGAACFNDNIKWMNENGTTIYLKANANQILERVLSEQNSRPLIKNLNKAELLFFIEQKLKEREPFYSQAKIILDTKELNDKTLSKLLNP